MSGPQHIRWFEVAQRAIGNKRVMDLQVRMAHSDQAFDAVDLLERLKEMAGRKEDDHG